MDFDKAQQTFIKFLSEVSDEDRAQFLIWIQRSYFTSMCRGHKPATARRTLKDIADTIKETVPIEGVLPFETFVTPIGENAGYDPKASLMVDSFLYNEMDLDDMDRECKLQRNYCQDCMSRKIEPLKFISHSTSVSQMDFIFGSFLPYLKDKSLLDVGSRLGAVLYGAHAFTPAARIVGIEINKDLCDIQRNVIAKHNMADRIEIICDDICNQATEVAKADVVFLMNVFEFFLGQEEQVKAWNFLKDNIKSGAIIVAVPSLEIALKNIPVGFDLNTWVKLRHVTDPLLVLSMQSQPDIAQVHTYDVL